MPDILPKKGHIYRWVISDNIYLTSSDEFILIKTDNPDHIRASHPIGTHKVDLAEDLTDEFIGLMYEIMRDECVSQEAMKVLQLMADLGFAADANWILENKHLLGDHALHSHDVETLMDMFSWSDTPQGFRYWMEIDDTMAAYR